MDNDLRTAAEEELSETLNETPVTIESLKEKYSQGTALNDGEVDAIADLAISFLREILLCFNEPNAEISEYEGEDNELILDINNGDFAVLIGKHGSTLEAIQKLTVAYVSKKIGFYFPLIIDIEGYRERRKGAVSNMALRAAQKAARTQRSVHLSPMSAYERRIVHMTLTNSQDVTTISEGNDEKRHIVVVPIINE